MFKSIIQVVGLGIVSLMFVACAAKKPVQPTLVWPPAPEEPRVTYVAMYTGERDFKKVSTLDAFIGEAAPGEGNNLKKPYGVTAKGDKFYVTDTAEGRVYVFDRKKKEISFLGMKPRGKLKLPVGLATDNRGRVFVSDAKLKKVYGYDGNGTLKVAIGKAGEFKRPAGVAINNAIERLYVVDSSAHMVKVYDLKGKHLFDFGERGVDEGTFNYPTNLAIDRRNGNVAVVDTQNFRVQVFDKDGEFLMTFGKIGDSVGNFARPKGIGIDSDGNMYVTDAAFSNFQIFNDKGQVLMYLGGPGSARGKFQLPAAAYIDENDILYVVGNFFGRVQLFQYLSDKWKKENPAKYQKLKSLD